MYIVPSAVATKKVFCPIQIKMWIYRDNVVSPTAAAAVASKTWLTVYAAVEPTNCWCMISTRLKHTATRGLI